MVHRSEFLRDFCLQVTTEFHRDGQDAQWASSASGPRFWGDEDETIELDASVLPESGRTRSAMAVSSDGRLLAVASSSIIRIVDVDTRKMLGELKGLPNCVGRLVFAPWIGKSAKENGMSVYRLVSVCQDDAGRGRGKVIIVWSLDSDGCQVGATPFKPFGTDDITDTAMSTIGMNLEQEHGATTEELASIRSALCNAIDAVEKKHRLKALPSVSGGLPHYNDTGLFGYDEEDFKVLYLSKNETTQHGMRAVDELPQIVLAGLRLSDAADAQGDDDNNQERKGEHLQTLRLLQGHTDMILSVAFSPDGKLVASASWDQTFRIWSAETGECLHTIGPTGNQNWTVTFTPSGEHVLLSGGGGRDKPSPLAMYNTVTGNEVSRLRHPDLDSWLRNIAIHPDGKSAAVINGISVLLWDLTQLKTDDEQPASNAIEILKLADPDEEAGRGQARMFRSFASFIKVSWVDGGKKLLVRANDNTVFVWDRERNVKWRLQRPDGVELPSFDTEFAYVSDGHCGMVVALDGDVKVRFWKL